MVTVFDFSVFEVTSQLLFKLNSRWIVLSLSVNTPVIKIRYEEHLGDQ